MIEILDLRSLNCPLPLLKVIQLSDKMLVGSTACVIVSDTQSIDDIEYFLSQNKNHLKQTKCSQYDAEIHYYLLKI